MGPLVDLPAVGLAEPMLPVPYRVIASRADTADTVTLTLHPVGAPPATVHPGQFMMVWAFGVGEVPISVSGATPDGDLLLTVRSIGYVSAAIVTTPVGAVLGLRGPYGTEWPVADAAGGDVLVAAGGLGLAPLRLAIDALAAGSPERPRSVTLVVGARQPDQLLYPGDLQRWADAGVAVHLTVDAADRNWHAGVGTATALIERLGGRYDLALVCGPELMMTSAAEAAEACGVDPERVWVSLERNMHCGIGHCGRCQLGPHLLCRDGAVVRWSTVAQLLEVRGR
jgi:NAD(P)H-flavin reductase